VRTNHKPQRWSNPLTRSPRPGKVKISNCNPKWTNPNAKRRWGSYRKIAFVLLTGEGFYRGVYRVLYVIHSYFSLEHPSSSSQVYRLLHCFQIQSKNSSFLWCKHLRPQAISIHALLIRHNHVDCCVLKLYYVMLYYYVYVGLLKLPQGMTL